MQRQSIKQILKDYWLMLCMVLLVFVILVFIIIGINNNKREQYRYAKVLIGDGLIKEGEIRDYTFAYDDGIKIIFKDGSIYYTVFENVVLIRGE